MSSKLETSLAGGGHKELSRLTGNWEGITKTWFEPGVLTDESPMKGSFRPLFDGRFIIHEYEGSIHGKPFQGMMIIGLNLLTHEYQIAWVDSFHMGTGIMLSASEKNSPVISVLGKYQTGGEHPQTWGWRTGIEFAGDNQMILSAWNITPDGIESLGTQTVFNRIQPMN